MKNLLLIFGFLITASICVQANNYFPAIVQIESSITTETDPHSVEPLSLADYNVIYKGRIKTREVGGEIITSCKGSRGICAIFNFTSKNLTQDVILYNGDGITEDRTIIIDASKPFSFTHSLAPDGEMIVEMKMTEVK